MSYRDKRIVLLSGHYGSGKTNVAVNLAMELKKTEERVSVADSLKLCFKSRSLWLAGLTQFLRYRDECGSPFENGRRILCREALR